MDYILQISSYEGLVPGACHYSGRIAGEHPPSCHGGMHMGNWHRDKDDPAYGKTTCAEGHVLPKRVEWDVHMPWTEDEYRRWQHSWRTDKVVDGPGQFRSKEELMRVAVGRFLGEIPPNEADMERQPDLQPGDRLWYGWISTPGSQDLVDESDGWGKCLAVRA